MSEPNRNMGMELVGDTFLHIFSELQTLEVNLEARKFLERIHQVSSYIRMNMCHLGIQYLGIIIHQ